MCAALINTIVFKAVTPDRKTQLSKTAVKRLRYTNCQKEKATKKKKFL